MPVATSLSPRSRARSAAARRMRRTRRCAGQPVSFAVLGLLSQRPAQLDLLAAAWSAGGPLVVGRTGGRNVAQQRLVRRVVVSADRNVVDRGLTAPLHPFAGRGGGPRAPWRRFRASPPPGSHEPAPWRPGPSGPSSTSHTRRRTPAR